MTSLPQWQAPNICSTVMRDSLDLQFSEDLAFYGFHMTNYLQSSMFYYLVDLAATMTWSLTLISFTVTSSAACIAITSQS